MKLRKVKLPDGEHCLFHCFGKTKVAGGEVVTIAVVEYSNGTVLEVPCTWITFCDQPTLNVQERIRIAFEARYPTALDQKALAKNAEGQYILMQTFNDWCSFSEGYLAALSMENYNDR